MKQVSVDTSEKHQLLNDIDANVSKVNGDVANANQLQTKADTAVNVAKAATDSAIGDRKTLDDLAAKAGLAVVEIPEVPTPAQ